MRLGDISFESVPAAAPPSPGGQPTGYSLVRKDDGTCLKNGVVVPCSEVMPTLVAGAAMGTVAAAAMMAFSIAAPIAIASMVKRTTKSAPLALLAGGAALYWIGPKITGKDGKQIFPPKFWEK